MTRKDYIKFAKSLRDLRRTISGYDGDINYHENIAYNTALDDMASDMCKIFSADNGNFDHNRFLTAAGVQP